MVTRHSKQIPIPHSGPRGSPLTDLRKNAAPEIATAAETIVPAGTVTGAPFTESVTGLFMLLSSRQVWLDRDRRRAPKDLIRDQLTCGERCRDPEPFVTGSEI